MKGEDPGEGKLKVSRMGARSFVKNPTKKKPPLEKMGGQLYSESNRKELGGEVLFINPGGREHKKRKMGLRPRWEIGPRVKSCLSLSPGTCEVTKKVPADGQGRNKSL